MKECSPFYVLSTFSSLPPSLPPPSLGKTATVHHVLGRLRKERRDLGFTHCEINGLTLSNPSQVGAKGREGGREGGRYPKGC